MPGEQTKGALTSPSRIEALAALVREEAEQYVARYGCGPALEGWCMVVSAALAFVFADAGISASIAGGWFILGDYVEGHRWVLVEPPFVVAPEQAAAYATIIDLTATQYPEADLPRVLICGPDDEGRGMYDLRKIGLDDCLEGMSENDLQHLEILAARCICAARTKAGLPRTTETREGGTGAEGAAA